MRRCKVTVHEDGRKRKPQTPTPPIQIQGEQTDVDLKGTVVSES